MDNYIFGIKAVKTEENVVNDFVNKSSQEGGNHNPYNKAFFNQPSNMAQSKAEGRITSIPSPYARMHITDLAFQESNCGIGVVNKADRRSIKLSADYKRALSHCLDIFELMYHADEIDLSEKGITLEKLNLVSTKSTNPEEISILKDHTGKLTKIGRYVETLDLYRDAYLASMQERRANVPDYKFDFTSLYLLKYKGKTFASTSPFTGFSAKADCNLDSADIKIDGRKILSSDPTTWRTVHERSLEFRKFMFLMLRDTGLRYIFQNLFDSIEDTFDEATKTTLANTAFDRDPSYDKFNLRNKGLQEISQDKTEEHIFIRPDGLDCSYLKYLLYLQTPADLTISLDEYNEDIDKRRFDGEFVKWIGVNDILAEALFILPYDINENYLSVQYLDKSSDNTMRPRCLVPIKRKALDFFDIKDIVSNLTIVKRDDKTFAVTLRIPIKNVARPDNATSYINLRREYKIGEAKFPNGTVIQGDNMRPFAFGVYPFVRSTTDLNIYKVLFYNVFENKYDLEFYYRDENNKVQPFIINNHSQNKTNDIYTNGEEVAANCEYHHLESKEGFEFAEIRLCAYRKGDEEGEILPTDAVYTALIVPKLREPHALPNNVNVAIDLGTSNTYIAYSVVDDLNNQVVIDEINTHHSDRSNVWNELTFMNKRCEEAALPEAPARNREDLILMQYDRKDARATDEFLDHQLCEFIPSRIDPKAEDECYSFPIPSVLNFLRDNGRRNKVTHGFTGNPLINTAIPFAYYERGIRQGAQRNYYDAIMDGSKFKWYISKDSYGNINTNDAAKAAFNAFVRELLFIVRSHIISKGYSLKNVTILWSYPLSFPPELVNEYQITWSKAYSDIIKKVKSGESANVHYTNESRTPIFECQSDPTNLSDLTLLVDIGGGSTDVIGYRDHKPQFITSFGFAGNALYLDSELNRMEPDQMQNTILMWHVKRRELFRNNDTDVAGLHRRSVSTEEPISTIMNYGFSKDPRFGEIFLNEGPKFMLLLHNAALIYHIAQLCHIKSPKEVPAAIYLTGNGSNLFNLNQGFKQMIKDIFGYVYKNDPESAAAIKTESLNDMKIKRPSNPKAATARGALKGYAKGQLATDDDSIATSIVMLGDGLNISDRNQGYGTFNVENAEQEVMKNVMSFLEMFYEVVYKQIKPIITKDEMLYFVDKNKNNSLLKVRGGLVTDSLFFQFIALILENVSQKLYDIVND